MEAAHRSSASSHNLFEVYLRLRPPPSNGTATERILTVETREGEHDEEGDDINLGTSHIVLNPPTDRRRAIEKFAFTRVFEEDASQLDVFHRADILPMVEGVLAPSGGEGTDAMVATLGVTGSGKTHTILGSKTQRGITQLSLDVIFSSLGDNMIDEDDLLAVTDSLQACDASESTLYSAAQFLDALYEPPHMTRSRAATPMIGESHGFMSPPPAARRNLHRISNAPQTPDVSHISVACDTSSEYAVVVSMYEVHNDRIYDLLCPPPRQPCPKTCVAARFFSNPPRCRQTARWLLVFARWSAPP
uniref:Kinesin motor domain-containing protein n=1 Tax=Bionectria ochroleuca TaxID=29856 RepID=A0A8H7N178_BIOOC